MLNYFFWMAAIITGCKSFNSSIKLNQSHSKKINCNFISKNIPKSLQTIPEIWISDNISYIHIYKAGGTTLFSFLNKLEELNYLTNCKFNFTTVLKDSLNLKEALNTQKTNI